MPIAKPVLAIAVLAIVGGISAALLIDRGAEDVATLRVANQKGQIKSMMVASGVLDDAPYRVEWSEFPAAQPLLEAVASGAADLGLAGDAPFIFAYQSGAPIRAIAIQAASHRAAGSLSIIVKRDSAIRSARDLAGKTIATTRGSIGHHLLLQALEQALVQADKVTVSFMPPGDAKAAFDSGAIDAWSTWTPYTNVAIKEGARVVADGTDFDLPFSVDVAHVPSIRPKHALLADFLKREKAALVWARAHPDVYAAALSKETGLPLDIARASLERSYRESRSVDAAIIAQEQAITDRFKRAGYGASGRKVEDAFDRSFQVIANR